MLKLRQILCPTDFSELSYEALRVGSHLAARFKAHLDLLHVIAPDQATNPLLVSRQREVQSEMPLADAPPASGPHTLASASRELHKVAAEQVVLPDKVIPRSLTRLGRPADEIIEVAKAEGSDLIVMGTHGLTGWRHLVLGSVAESVVHRASCPVLTIREPQDGATFQAEAPRKILCSTDFSEASFAGLSLAGELAREYGAELILMHAVEPFTGYSGLILEPSAIEAFTIEETTQNLNTALQGRVPAGVQTQALAVWGEAAEAIANAARTHHADLVVIATHGVTGWRHVLLGSVAERVVRLAPCPVLSVPVPRTESMSSAAAAVVPASE